jgi:hypothetical protein
MLPLTDETLPLTDWYLLSKQLKYNFVSLVNSSLVCVGVE